jgi:hypothetical protein
MIPWIRPRRTPGLIAGALSVLAAVAPAFAQTPFELYRERTAMLAAGANCHLFDAQMTAALGAAQAQARTAALRAGATPEALDHGAAQARSAVAEMVCGSVHVQQSADRARTAFHAYSGLRTMAFPGDVGGWQATRVMPLKSAAWRLSQDAFAGQDKVVFGVAGQDGTEAITLAVAPSDGAEPYAARLILRDRGRLPQPFLTPASAPLSARIPLRAAAKVVMAEARSEADPALRPLGARTAVAFRFPPATRGILVGLDPREAVSVELLYPSSRGEMVRTAFVEVGDFDAALAFLKAGPSR